MLNMLTSYFSDRRQVVCYNDSISIELEQRLGIVQGSRLGPLMYDIYSNDFNKLCFNDENLLYADDTCIFYVGENLQQLCDHVNNRLRVIHDWCNANKLAVNPKKSEFMILTNKKIDIIPILKIGNEPIRMSDKFKYLGVYIDRSLKFNSHYEHLVQKMSHLRGVSFRLKYKLNLKTAKNFYFACVYGVFSYCVAVFGGMALCTNQYITLEKLQRHILTNLFSRFHNPSSCYFKTLKILKFREAYKLRAATYMYRVLKRNEFPELRAILELDTPTHSFHTRSIDDELFLLPFPRVSAIRINFGYQFIDVWNNIPLLLKNSPSLSTFKKALTNHLLSTY